MDAKSPISLALEHFNGSQAALARAAGVTQPAIHKVINAKRVSAEMALKIEAATEGAVPRHIIRPDLWSAPRPASSLAEAS